MRRSIPKSGLLDGGTGEEIFQDFLDGEYARILARQGAGSLARLLYEQLRSGEE
jgi:Rod binding domain-containing protein